MITRTTLALLLAMSLIAAACGDSDDDAADSATDTAAPTTEASTTEAPATTAAPTTEAPTTTAAPTTDAPTTTEVAEPEPEFYDGGVAALIVRRVVGELDEFTSTRDAYVADLEAQPGIVADREFLPFLSFTTFAQPDPPVYIGFTSGASLPEFGAAAGAVSEDLSNAYFPTFENELFGILRPLDPATPVDIASIAAEPGNVIAIAIRDLSTYEDFEPDAYAAARDAYLEALAEADGWVSEHQWVSADGGSLAIGMTVYADSEAFQAAAGDVEFNESEVAVNFLGSYPVSGGFAAISLK